MSSLNEKPAAANPRAVQRVQTLIIGRLLIIFLLLVANGVWNTGALRISYEDFPQGLFVVFFVSVGLTIAYSFVLRFGRDLDWQIRAQFLLDSLLITWLVWRSGDISSPFITLYIVLIGVASFFLRPLWTIFLAVFCGFLLVVLAILAYYSIIESFGPIQASVKSIQIVGFHLIAILVVGLLSSKLAEKRSSGAELEKTIKTLANLQLLHERIVESIRSGLATTDLEGTIYSFNTAASEITGYRFDEVEGRSIYDLFGDIREQIDLSLAAFGDGDHLPRFETDLVTPEGFAVRIGFSVSLLFSESHEANGLIITFQDLTEIRSMEESIRRKDRLAAVGRVAAGLAHEIRNPLGAMRGAIQVLESSTPATSSQAGLMDIILKESDRLNKIITNFLSYARPAKSEFEETDLSEVIRDTFALLRHSPDIRENHDLVSEISDEPVLINADPAQLKQIFWNLTRNALQAMENGGELRIGLERLPNNRIRITFKDTGRGMSPQQVEQLFEPFSESTSGGTGLGLSIVYQIVKDHNGSINVSSRENVGTTISVDLPTDNRSTRSVAATEKDGITKLSGLLNVGDIDT